MDISSVLSPVLIWFLLGIAFFFIELMLPSFIIFFLGLGAWCVALLLAVVDVSLNTQMTVFLSSSLTTLILLRSWVRSVFLGDTSEESDSVNMDSAPATGVVTEAITPPAAGRIKYSGSFWQAVADEPFAVGAVVQIVEQKNLVVKVGRLETGFDSKEKQK